MYERDDFPLAFQTLQPTPFRQATEAVIAPAGQARAEWAIIDDLTRRLCAATRRVRGAGGARKRWICSVFGFTPRLLVDAIIRLGEGGDRFGLRRGGLTFARLTAEHPHGAVLAPTPARRSARRHRRLPGRPGAAAARRHRRRGRRAVARRSVPDGYPLRLIGMREARSENSWMHNAPLLMRGERVQRALMHVDDAAAANIVDGDLVRVSSPHGEIEVPVTRDQGHRRRRDRRPARLGPQGHRRLADRQRRRRRQRQPADVQRAPAISRRWPAWHG